MHDSLTGHECIPVYVAHLGLGPQGSYEDHPVPLLCAKKSVPTDHQIIFIHILLVSMHFNCSIHDFAEMLPSNISSQQTR